MSPTKNIIRVKIEKNHGMYSAFSEVRGVWGAGNTLEEAKQSTLEVIRLLIEYNETKNIPPVLLEGYDIEFELTDY